MTRALTVAALLVFSINRGYSQDAARTPAFEVASIEPCKPGTPEPPGEHMGMVQFTSPGGRFRATATSLKFLMEWSWGIQPGQHSPGPSWMENDRYDIVAKAPGNPSDEEMKLMVRTLLADRFRLKVHRENKQMAAYVISVGKTAPRLETPKDSEVHSIKVLPQKDQDQKTVSWHVVATRYTLAQLTDTFARQLGRPIVNETGLDGEYDFTLDMTPDENTPNPLDPTLIMDAMRRQLGLTMKTQDTAVDYFVIDNAEKVASGN
jgi:uncharacterized protein (TIGR03435 family)